MNNDFLLDEFQQTEVKTKRKATSPAPRRKQKPLWREYVEVILISLVAAILLRLFVVSAYRVDSASMEEPAHGGVNSSDHILRAGLSSSAPAIGGR